VSESDVLAILRDHLSDLTARSLLNRCAAAIGVRPADIRPEHLPALARELDVGVRMFARAEEQAALLTRLRRLTEAVDAETRRSVHVGNEGDIVKARAAARELAGLLGGNTFVTQNVVTATSELARNIVYYARSGDLVLIAKSAPRKSLRVVASDTGPGIADVELVLSGRYKSQTGLGRGLLGLRRLANDFSIKTGPGGTTVEAEFVF
jgi:serine/threonine-protein kinase RsbT